jgi:hypothetical protein
MKTYSEAELDAMSVEQVRQLAMDEIEEIEANAAKAAAEQEAADKAAAEKAAAEAVETPEQVAERQAAEREAAAQEATDKAAAEKAAEQERDAQGRFAKKDEKTDDIVVPTEEVDNGEPDEWVIRREIDLGDGGGIQVYEGRGATELDAVKDLNDKLVVAQEHGTRTIREFQKKHPKEPEPPKAPEISEDLEYVFKQQFEKKPSEAFKAMFKELTGMDVTEFKTWQSAQRAADEARNKQDESLRIQREWVSSHPEYITSAENGDQIRDWVRDHNYNEFTQENLEKAFEDLSQRGLLKLKTDEASVPTKVETTTVVKAPARIEQTVTPVVETTPVRSPRKASSVSTIRSSAPVVKTELTEDDLYAMPMDKLKDLSNKQLQELSRQ